MKTDRTDRPGKRSTGSYAMTGNRRGGLWWLPWLALLLLALLLFGIFALMRNVGDEGDKPGLDLTNDRRGGATENGSDRTGNGTGSGTGATNSTAPSSGSGTASGNPGQLTSGGQSLIPLASSGGLARLSGQAVAGRAVPVESVVADEGFWAGNSPSERVFVFLTPEARTSKGESPFQVRAGQKLNLSGTLREVPNDLTPFGVDAAEGAAQLRTQGQYVEADAISLS